ncbi:hypothetical protein [Burkholderia gladioli]|uniref:hypothetical protein n=1 Tax=Burkholderia gladioli TaxID=28095 RepID=UPI00163EE2AB|nr:hypothetical protein [Burkholderia gladioli]
MADLVQWPAMLPAPRASGYNVQPTQTFVRTDMDNGSARQRRRFTTVPNYVDVTWMLSIDQFSIFEAFLAYDINLGADWFATSLLNGLGVSQMQARFKDNPPYKAALSDSRTYFNVTASLEVKSMPLLTRDQYSVAKQYSATEIDAMSNGLHQLVHVQLPGPGRWE